MKKLWIILMVALLLVGCTNVDDEVDPNQTMVEEMLDGFYEDEYWRFEIYYGEDETDLKDAYLEATKDWYVNGKYEEILNYNVENEISIIRTND